MWTRRAFLASSGAVFLTSLPEARAETLLGSELLFATAGMRRDGSFAAAIVNEAGETISTISMPDRGHDVAECPLTGHVVVFARRPGTFALVFDRAGTTLQTLTSVEGRHFFGHGEFSTDGRLLYATENDYDAGRGMIGIYDATDHYRRIGEFYSGGVGPHDVLVDPEGRYLVVANGGIETHPDYGRAKLNISSMQPNLCWLDRQTGEIVATHELPQKWHQLSLRHLAFGPKGRLFVGGQYQGGDAAGIPLLAHATPDEELQIAAVPDALNNQLSGYVGALAASPDGNQIVATSPVGGAALVWDVASQKGEIISFDKVCGVAWTGDDFALSTGGGAFREAGRETTNLDYYFDHHMVRLKA